MNDVTFEWVAFYRELAQKLLPYKDNRQDLVKKVYQIYEMTGINMPKLDMDHKLFDIDPFTFFGLFNKHLSDENRIKMVSAIAELFDIKAKIPTSFEGIPLVNNQKATYYWFLPNRGKDDINNLWKLFESALFYDKESLNKYFNICINYKGNAIGKITMGLYWIAPDTFLNLDSRNTWYICESGKIPKDVVSSLPKMESKISAEEYFRIVDKLQAYLHSDRSPINSFKELSYEAWRYSNQQGQEEKVQEEEAQEERNDVLAEIIPKYLPYRADDFLQDVYMTLTDYKTLVGLLRRKKNVILEGAPGVGKTYAAKRLAYSMMGVKDKERVTIVQFHQSYSYEDFVMGYRPTENGFELKTGVFYDFCKKAEKDSDNAYFFIIDEINRGNLSKIFGELFMLIENDKRGIEMRLLYANEQFAIPKNVYIIGMMNTADRSLAMLDYALRRRFAFFEMKPGFDSEGFKAYQQSLESPKFDRLIDSVKQLNEEIAEDETLGDGFCIGHSYFCQLTTVTDEILKQIVNYELIPLLKEYWFDEPEKVQHWKKTLRSAIA